MHSTPQVMLGIFGTPTSDLVRGSPQSRLLWEPIHRIQIPLFFMETHVTLKKFHIFSYKQNKIYSKINIENQQHLCLADKIYVLDIYHYPIYDLRFYIYYYFKNYFLELLTLFNSFQPLFHVHFINKGSLLQSPGALRFPYRTWGESLYV